MSGGTVAVAAPCCGLPGDRWDRRNRDEIVRGMTDRCRSGRSRRNRTLDRKPGRWHHTGPVGGEPAVSGWPSSPSSTRP